ncbi:MAG: tRNA uridine-5-carboxymethylaminomethyl(34) synthesis GTPase MnmE [Gemmatimonadetes bacterium]|nr:tRNA uridine-5-carboxymethylaminomethyl(34) synthesis GTPase MnmE [Gemmatimonadota bacterium]
MDTIEVDTIAAISTPPGAGAVALIRLSGPGAIRVLARIAPGLGTIESRRVHLAAIRDPRTGELLDRALVSVHRAPASYTGEDVVEICGHGGWLGPALLMEACVAAGARAAGAGEFTRRAYLNGRMDLVQAEAVADLIGGRSGAARRAALGQLDRGLSARIGELRAALIGLEALLVHHLDFPEEDEPPVSLERIAEEADGVAARLRALLATASEGELLREGALAVLAGRPNSGKSSLFNALLGQERAIVTDLPGTTRDALEVPVSLGGFPFRLVDTAGLREAADRIEGLGIEVARRFLAAADLILLCVEGTRALGADEIGFLGEWSGRAVLVVRTKGDLDDGATGGAQSADVGAPTVRVCALTGQGLDALRDQAARVVYRGLSVESHAPVLTRARHTHAVRVALEEVEAFAEALRGGVGPEVAAAHLRPAESALEEMLGAIMPEEVLDRVFAEFCIGK